MVLRPQTKSGLFTAQRLQRPRPIAPTGQRFQAILAGLMLATAAVQPACHVEPEQAQDLKLARKVEQVLEDPASLPLAASPAAVEFAPAAEAATPAAAAAPAEVPAPPTAVAGAVVAPPIPAAVPGAAAAPDPAAMAAAAQVAAAAQLAASTAEKAEQAKQAKADRQDKTAKSDAAKSDDAARKAESARKAETAKHEAAQAKTADDVVIPEGADATDLYTSGKRKLTAGDYAGAIQDLRASNKLRYSVRTLTTLGRAYFDAGQMALAEKSFKAAGTFDEAMLLLAQLYQQTGKPGQARKVYEHFLQIHADHPKAEWARKMVQAL